MRKTTVSYAITQYFKTTTLHGFKYLCSAYCGDRVGWLVCCCASACCAGLLCAVLWARFLEMPGLLTLWDNVNNNEFMQYKVPNVVVCPETESVADMFLDKLSRNKTETARIPITLAHLLAGKSTANDQVQLLHDLLVANSITLPEVMMNYTPSCKEHTKKCRYQEFEVPCEEIFEKELTTWGLCCVMRPKKLRNISQKLLAKLHTTEMLELVLECSYGSRLYGCRVVTMYDSEEYLDSDNLQPGYYYMAQLRFVAVPENPATENLVEKMCVSDEGYSRTLCMLKCAERACGCSDPLHFAMDHSTEILPMCPVTRIGCLKGSEYKKNVTCNCLPACKKITTFMTLESSPMNIMHTIDPFYAEVNVTSSIVVNLRVNLGLSRIYVLNPTETWFTLLSSLGGIFNMFLGVGLFSALEFLFLVLVRLPITIKKWSEIDPTQDVKKTTGYISRPVNVLHEFLP